MSDPSGSTLVGTTVGNYQILRRLGAGAMGEVYLGEHPEIGRRVAIKVLIAQLSASPEMSQRFIAEARAVNRINHPNIIQIFDFGRLPDQRLYYTMEFLEGQELTELLRQRAPLSVQDTLAILAQIVGALDAAHKVGIVHRDLKPDNIFVADTPSGPIVKVLDFGIAKLLEPGLGSQQRTSTGMIMGTPLYMSPEQAAGQVNDISAQSDLYALGIIVYQMLSGRVPFDAPTAAQILAAHITEPPRPLREVTSGLPEGIHAVVERTLSKQPSLRPQSATALFRDFHAACAELPMGFTATVSLPGYPGLGGVSSGAGSRPGVVAGALGSGARGGGGSYPGVASGLNPAEAQRIATQPTTLGQSASQVVAGAPRTSRAPLYAVLIALVAIAGAAAAYVLTRPKGSSSKESPPRAAAGPGADARPAERPRPEADRAGMTPGPAVIKVHRIAVESRTPKVRVEVTVAGQKPYSKRPPFTVDAKTGERVTLRASRPGYLEQVESLVATEDRKVSLELEQEAGTARPSGVGRRRTPARRVEPPPEPRVVVARPRPDPRPAMRRYGESTISPFDSPAP